MSVGTFLDIAGLPGMDLAVTAAYELGKSVQNIKVYRTQCRDLGDRCAKLLLAFRDQCKGLEGSEFAAAADEVSNIIERAHRRASQWASWNRVKSLVNQSDIKQGLEQLYKEIDDCAQRFNIAAAAGLHRGHRELQQIHERDTALNRDMLRNILQSVDGLRDVLSDPNAVRPIMQTIQEQLQEGSVLPEQSRELQQGLYEIHRRTKYLPPIVDLTGQIERISRTPLAYGAYNDVYMGLWLGEEKVALKFARALNHTEKARKRFHKEVEIWRDLQHRHICRLYGIFYEENQIYSVSPWMESGSALDYINSTEEIINRVNILGDVASGMEYLHGRGVVHGDLRAANILIGDDGRACVSDFGLSRVIEEVAPEMSSTNHGDSPVRWQAPELLQLDECDSQTPVSPATDVWSFGMLCLEILSGKKPYHNRIRDAMIVAELLHRRLPMRPVEEAVIGRGLDDRMWDMMLHCWRWEASERPTMAAVKARIRALQSGVSASPRPIYDRPLHDSPNQLARELAPVSGQSPAITIPRRTTGSLSPGAPYRSPPSPSPLSQVPPIHSTPPKNISLGIPGTAVRRHPPSQGSSGSSFSLSSQIGHRPSVSSILGQSAKAATTGSSALGVSLGVSPPKTPQNAGYPGGNAIVVPMVVRPHSSHNELQRSASVSSNGSNNADVFRPSHLSLTNPMRNPTSPTALSSRERSSSSSPGASSGNHLRLNASADTSRSARPPPDVSSSFATLSASDSSPTSPLRVTADTTNEAPQLPSIHSSQAFSIGNMSISSIPEDAEDRLRARQHSDIRRFPPSHSSGEHAEGDPSGGSISSSFPSSVDSPFTRARSSSSFDAIPPRCQLLDFSGLDLSTCLILNRDGSVKAASLGGLIDYLLEEISTVDSKVSSHSSRLTLLSGSAPGDRAKQKHLAAFLATHKLFASTTDVLKHLLYRFTMADSDRKLHAQDQVDIKYRVLKLLGEWLAGRYAKVLELPHLNDLRLFLQDVTIYNSARELISTIDYLMASHPSRATSPALSHSGSKRSARSGDITPLGLAVALSVLEGKKYRAITALDCVHYLLHNGSQSGASNKVAEARITNNKIVLWVKKSVTRSNTLDSRQETLRFFINTAAECHKLHNYSSMSALLAGIESPQLSRLKLTCRLEKQATGTLKKLSVLLDIGHNHRSYREALPKPGTATCNPYLAVHLKDLQLVYERHPTRVNLDSEFLINFEKFVRVHDSILTLLAFQSPDGNLDGTGPGTGTENGSKVDFNLDTDRERRAGPLVYLEEQLAKIHVTRVAEDAVEQRSLELQKIEDRDFEYRVKELSAVGFRTRGSG